MSFDNFYILRVAELYNISKLFFLPMMISCLPIVTLILTIIKHTMHVQIKSDNIDRMIAIGGYFDKVFFSK
jgi:hypothetical protein